MVLALEVAAVLIVAAVLFQATLGAVGALRRFAAEGRQQRRSGNEICSQVLGWQVRLRE